MIQPPAPDQISTPIKLFQSIFRVIAHSEVILGFQKLFQSTLRIGPTGTVHKAFENYFTVLLDAWKGPLLREKVLEEFSKLLSMLSEFGETAEVTLYVENNECYEKMAKKF